MSCRGACKPPGPQLQYHLVGLGQQILCPALLCHLLTMGQSRAHPLSSTPPRPSACRDRKHCWDLPSRASSSAGQGYCPQQHQGPPSPAGTPSSVRKARWVLHCHGDTVRPRQHSRPGETASLQSTQACCRRGRNKPCPVSFFFHRSGQRDWRTGQSKVKLKHAHGDRAVPLCTFSTNCWKQSKYVKRAKADGGDSVIKKNKQWVFHKDEREENKCRKATPNLPLNISQELTCLDGSAGSCGAAKAMTSQESPKLLQRQKEVRWWSSRHCQP